MELDEKRRGSIDFTAQLEKARNILKFSGFYNIYLLQHYQVNTGIFLY